MKLLLSIALAWLVVTSSASAESNAPSTRPPNIVFIMVDDMGWADLGCYGSRAIQTPHLDRMAAEGMRFTQAYSGCTVCAPARSVLMTGYHVGHATVRGNTGGVPLRDEDVTVAEVLKQAGYTTGGFGKWGLGDLETSGVPERQGFDEFFGYYHQVHANYFYPDYLIHNSEKVSLPGNANFFRTSGDQGFYPSVDPKTGQKRQFTQDLIFEKTKQFIRTNHDRPFFCYAPWTPPHGRFEMPADDPAVKLYADKPWSQRAKIVAAMDSMIDRQVGEILALLKELNIDQQTIVFFCSDHCGAARYEGELDSCGPLRGHKRYMTEGGLRVPMLVRWPDKIAAGSESDHICYFGDMMKTFAELAKTDKGIPKNVDSLSFVPTLLGQPDNQPKHDFLYWESPRYDWPNRKYDGLKQAVRRGDWKLFRHHETHPWELYNLANDLSEKINLAGVRPELVQELTAIAAQEHSPAAPQVEPRKPPGRSYR